MRFIMQRRIAVCAAFLLVSQISHVMGQIKQPLLISFTPSSLLDLPKNGEIEGRLRGEWHREREMGGIVDKLMVSQSPNVPVFVFEENSHFCRVANAQLSISSRADVYAIAFTKNSAICLVAIPGSDKSAPSPQNKLCEERFYYPIKIVAENETLVLCDFLLDAKDLRKYLEGKKILANIDKGVIQIGVDAKQLGKILIEEPSLFGKGGIPFLRVK